MIPGATLEAAALNLLAGILAGWLIVEAIAAWRRRRRASHYRPSPYFRTAAPLHGMRGWQVGKAYQRNDNTTRGQ